VVCLIFILPASFTRPLHGSFRGLPNFYNVIAPTQVSRGSPRVDMHVFRA